MIAFTGYVLVFPSHRGTDIDIMFLLGVEPSAMVGQLPYLTTSFFGRLCDNQCQIGLFLGSGKILATAGPGGAVLAYAIMGTVISAVISSVGEMTALMPVNAPMMEFPRRFLDRGVGFAVGWIYW